MPKFSEGPWSTDERYWDDIHSRDGNMVAQVVAAKDEATSHANARLIAAAPEMLEVLKSFPMLTVPAVTAYGRQVQDWQEEVLAVIAKAEEGQ